MSQTRVISLSPSLLRLDGGTQVRPKLCPKALAKYTRLYKNGRSIDPVRAVKEGENYWLYDGFHRVRSAFDAGCEYIKVEVTDGTLDLARWLASGANARHGVPLSGEARRNAVRLALSNRPEDTTITWRSLANRCGVDHHTAIYVAVSDHIAQNPGQSDASIIEHFGSQNLNISDSKLNRIRARMEKEKQHRENKLAPRPASPASQSPNSGEFPTLTPKPFPTREDFPPECFQGERIELPPVPQKRMPQSKTIPMPDVLKDANGKTVPDHLKGAFGDPALREVYDLVCLWKDSLDPDHVLRVIGARLKALPYINDSHLSAYLKGALLDLEGAAEIIRNGFPEALCPICDGNGCAECALAGCVPLWRYKEILECN